MHSTDASRSSPARAAVSGREHALLFASEGAKVVVNDLGGDMHGEGGDPSSAMQIVDEIKAMGGEAVVNGDNVADWDGAQRLVQQAVDTFGDLHVLVNNAGILRDRVIINMTEAEWDAVINVHLKGHFCPTRHAAVVLAGADEGRQDRAARRSSTRRRRRGCSRIPGQANYDAAKTRHRDALAGLREGARRATACARTRSRPAPAPA